MTCRPILPAIGALLLMSSAVSAQVPPATCSASTASAPSVPTVRITGEAERVDEIILDCTGGVPIAAGLPLPQLNLQVFLNTNLTSRLLNGTFSEALVMVNDPAPSVQRVCASPGDTTSGAGICTILSNGGNAYDGTAAHPNVFQGRQAANNSVVFLGVPFNPPGPGNLRFRFTNLRANATLLGSSPAAILSFVSISGPVSLAISNPTQTVAMTSADMNFAVNVPTDFEQCVSQNPALATSTSGFATDQNFWVRFLGPFANDFKKRDTAPIPAPLADQNIPGMNYHTETGFFNSAFPSLVGQGNLGLAGLADQGTRLLARFENIPAGVRLYSQAQGFVVNSVPAVVGMGQMQGFPPVDPTTKDSYTPVTATGTSAAGPIAPIVMTGPSTGYAIYEVLDADPATINYVDVRLFVAFDASSGVPGVGTATIKASLTPISSVGTADLVEAVPRFIDPMPAPMTGFTITATGCAMATDVSAEIAITKSGYFVFGSKVLQSVTIKNVGPSPIAAPISLVLDSLSSNTSLLNKTGLTNAALPANSPYINFSVAGGVLNPSQTATVTLNFAKPASGGITYTTRVLAGSAPR